MLLDLNCTSILSRGKVVRLFVCLSVCLSVGRSVGKVVRLFVCLSVGRSVGRSVHLDDGMSLFELDAHNCGVALKDLGI